MIDNIPQASTGEFASSGISGDFQFGQDPVASLNPGDIEDITILKDASSTAIYGKMYIRDRFRTSEIKDGRFCINGVPILVKGANRHEHSQLGRKMCIRDRL